LRYQEELNVPKDKSVEHLVDTLNAYYAEQHKKRLDKLIDEIAERERKALEREKKKGLSDKSGNKNANKQLKKLEKEGH
jgi:hypothetical protein